MNDLQVSDFDYSLVSESTTSVLKNKETQLNGIYFKYTNEVGKILFEAQQELADYHNDGLFGKWVESVGFRRQRAYEYINIYKFAVRISDNKKLDVFNSQPKTIKQEMSKPSALPEVNQAVFDGDITTHKEYKEMEKRLKEQDAIIARQAETISLKNNTIAEKDDIIYRQGEQKTQVIEVEKEVIPSDYETLKLEREDLKQQLKETDKQIEELKKMKAEHLEKSAKYDEMNEFNKKTKGKVNEEQERLQMLKQVYEMIELSKELLIKLTPMPYVIDKKYVQETPLVKSRLRNTAEQINKFYKNLMELLNESEILEGEIINE